MGYTVAIHNLGCKVNYYEAVKMQEELKESGFNIVDFEDLADIYIVNTCTVTNIADKKSRQMLNRAKHKNPNAIVVAAGCYVKVNGENLKETLDIDLLVDNKGKDKIVEVINEELKEKHLLPIHDRIKECEGLYEPDSHCRAFLKIQDGCDRYCSYCLIPFARGRVESMDYTDIMNQAKKMANFGYKELVLTGIHISSYGRGFSNEKTALADLMNDISNIEGIERIRLGSLEQGIITEDFLNRIYRNVKILPHFHLSLQSGCDTVLKRMNRKYTTREYLSKCELIRKFYDKPAITTDIIVGFPQETKEEFQETVAFVKEVKFFEAHIFPYSIRTGTRAAKMSGQLSNSVKKERSFLLTQVMNGLRKEYIHSQIGDVEEVLFEETVELNGTVYYKGHSKRYVPVYLKCEKTNIDLTNHIIRGRMIRSMKDGVEYNIKEE